MRLLLCLVILSAGCGNPGGVRPVRIAMVANAYTHLPVVLAEKLGFYRAEGVDVEIQPLRGTNKTAEALLAGSAEMATSGYADVVSLVAGGHPLRCVVANTIRDGRAIVASPARKDIRSMKDLKGTNFGVPGIGSANHQFALLVFARFGLGPDDASFAGVGVGAPLVGALERGTVSAAVLGAGDASRVRRRHPGIATLADASISEGPGVIWPSGKAVFAVLYAKRNWIDANRDKVARIVRADCRALAWIQSHSAEELLDVLPPEYRMGSREEDLAALLAERRLYSPDGRMPPGGPQTIVESLALVREDFRSAKIDLAGTFTDEFIPEEK